MLVSAAGMSPPPRPVLTVDEPEQRKISFAGGLRCHGSFDGHPRRDRWSRRHFPRWCRRRWPEKLHRPLFRRTAGSSRRGFFFLPSGHLIFLYTLSVTACRVVIPIFVTTTLTVFGR